MRMKTRFVFLLSGLAVLLAVIGAITPSSLSAQSALRWSPAQRIRGIADISDTPYLVADQNRTVYAFNSQWTGNDLAVFVTQWTAGNTWTAPVDILLSPNAHQATVLGAFLDPKSMIHVIFFGGTEQGAEIYYSRAPAVNASEARAWSSPKIVGQYAGKLASAALVGDNKGGLFIVYSGNRDGNGLYETHSTDGGKTWTDPKTVFLTNSTNLWVYAIQAALDSQDRLHVVWTVKNVQGTGNAVYYARLESDHKQWGLPIILQATKGGDYQADWASIISYKDKLFVIYDYGFPPQRRMRQSVDGGLNWTDSILPFPTLVGETGHPVFLVDGNNVLHLVFANRTSDNSVHALWHSVWQGNQWSPPDSIVAGPLSPQFDPSRPQAVISQGNVLLATWRQDPGLNGNGVWYSYATLDEPALPTVVLPTAAPTSTAAPSPTIIGGLLAPSPTNFPVPAVTPQVGGAPPLSGNDTNMGILIAVLPVLLILIAIVVARNVRASV